MEIIKLFKPLKFSFYSSLKQSKEGFVKVDMDASSN